jgi:hypothetical protein
VPPEAVDPTRRTSAGRDAGGRRSPSTRAVAPAGLAARNRNKSMIAPSVAATCDHPAAALRAALHSFRRPASPAGSRSLRSGRSGAHTFTGFPTGNLLGVPLAHPLARIRRGSCPATPPRAHQISGSGIRRRGVETVTRWVSRSLSRWLSRSAKSRSSSLSQARATLDVSSPQDRGGRFDGRALEQQSDSRAAPPTLPHPEPPGPRAAQATALRLHPVSGPSRRRDAL